MNTLDTKSIVDREMAGRIRSRLLNFRRRPPKVSSRTTRPLLSGVADRIAHVFEELMTVDPRAGEAALVERIGELESLKSAAAAAQARATAALAATRAKAEEIRGVPR